MRSLLFFLLLLTVSVSAGLPETLKEASFKIKASASGALFLRGETLHFTTRPEVRLPARWHVKDWNGRICASGINRWGEIGLPPLPVGYYYLHHEGVAGKRSFAVVEKISGNPEGYFALCGSSFSTVLRYSLNLMRDNPRCPDPAEARRLLAELPRKLGVSMVREILHWHRVEPAPGKFDWLFYFSCAEAMRKNGVGLVGMIPYQPSFYTRKGATLPEDLHGLFRFSREMARTFNGMIQVLEYSNEPDLAWIKEPPWDYVAAMKAACLGYKAGNPDVKVTNGGIAFADLNAYSIEMLNNGMGDYIDLFNVHTYADLRDYPGIMKKIRLTLEKYGLAHLPIWFTENGGWPEGLAECDNIMRGTKAHSGRQERIMAEFLPKMMILLQSYGVERDFAFSLSAYNENAGTKDWGLLRRDYTVKPALAVFANLTARLGRLKYVGTFEPGKGIRGFLYEDLQKKQTLVFWSESELDTLVSQPRLELTEKFEKKFLLPQKEGVYTLFNEVGTPSAVRSVKGKISLTSCRNIRILTGLSGLAAAVPAVKRSPEKAGHDYDKTIVFKAAPSAAFKLADSRIYLEVPEKAAAFAVDVFNFSDKEKRGTLCISGGKEGNIRKSVTVPSMGKSRVTFDFFPKLDKNFFGRMLVTGEFNNKKCSVLSVAFSSTSARKANCREAAFPGLMDPRAWNVKNTAGVMTCTLDPKERALVFTVKFKPGEARWTAPEYLLQLPQESLAGALGFTYECRTDDPEGIFVNGVQLADKERKYVSLRVPPYKQKWEKRTVWFDSQSIVKPADACYLRFGLNTVEKCSKITYRVRRIKLLYP
ncbi:MAG: hypothetical protein IKC65_05845 [Lentisphaeria bacterium]|nr:hypothetical protein [Lentisphaeria bacterium]